MKITPVLNNQNKYSIQKINNRVKKSTCNNFDKNTTYPNNYFLSFTGIKPIRFEKAQSIGEAKDFGRRMLGIARYVDFYDEFDDLNVINYINEGLVELRNISRFKPRMPRYIYLEDLNTVQMSTKYNGAEISINRKIYGTEEIQNEIHRIFNELKKDRVIAPNGLNKDFETPEAKAIFNKCNKNYTNIENLSYDEKIELYNEIRMIYERTSHLNRFPKDLIIKMLEAGCWGEFDASDVELFAKEINLVGQDENFKVLYNFLKEYDSLDFKIKNNSFKHRTLFHEIGHLQDWDIFYMPNANEYASYDKSPKEMKEWVNNREGLKAAFEVSPYACYGAAEFIAETYAMMLNRVELSENVKKLYKKLGGPKVVLRQN